MTRHVAALLRGVTFYSHPQKLSFWPGDSEIMTSPAVRTQSFILRLCLSGQRGQRSSSLRRARPPPSLSEMPGSCQSPANHTVMHMSYRQRLGDGLLSLQLQSLFFMSTCSSRKKKSVILLKVEIDDCLIFPLPQAFPCGIWHRCCKDNISSLATDLISALWKGLSERRVKQPVNRFCYGLEPSHVPVVSGNSCIQESRVDVRLFACLMWVSITLPLQLLCLLHQRGLQFM